jgi:hypothetical protein
MLGPVHQSVNVAIQVAIQDIGSTGSQSTAK